MITNGMYVYIAHMYDTNLKLYINIKISFFETKSCMKIYK